jgi:hypothetical protein
VIHSALPRGIAPQHCPPPEGGRPRYLIAGRSDSQLPNQHLYSCTLASRRFAPAEVRRAASGPGGLSTTLGGPLVRVWLAGSGVWRPASEKRRRKANRGLSRPLQSFDAPALHYRVRLVVRTGFKIASSARRNGFVHYQRHEHPQCGGLSFSDETIFRS